MKIKIHIKENKKSWELFRILFLFNILIFIDFFKYETIETHARAFLTLIISAIGTVLWIKFDVRHFFSDPTSQFLTAPYLEHTAPLLLENGSAKYVQNCLESKHILRQSINIFGGHQS